ncbi:MAG: hypothetical protein LKG25_08025 [Prevotella sp.]|jgi:hypothetical protein|nr:hypothetical protein [Prevotella sp.]MCI1282525.1 hypothetical protein [Prevotella sp.]
MKQPDLLSPLWQAVCKGVVDSLPVNWDYPCQRMPFGRLGVKILTKKNGESMPMVLIILVNLYANLLTGSYGKSKGL